MSIFKKVCPNYNGYIFLKAAVLKGHISKEI